MLDNCQFQITELGMNGSIRVFQLIDDEREMSSPTFGSKAVGRLVIENGRQFMSEEEVKRLTAELGALDIPEEDDIRWLVCNNCGGHGALVLGDGTSTDVRSHTRGVRLLQSCAEKGLINAARHAELLAELEGFGFPETDPVQPLIDFLAGMLGDGDVGTIEVRL